MQKCPYAPASAIVSITVTPDATASITITYKNADGMLMINFSAAHAGFYQIYFAMRWWSDAARQLRWGAASRPAKQSNRCAFGFSRAFI